MAVTFDSIGGEELAKRMNEEELCRIVIIG